MIKQIHKELLAEKNRPEKNEYLIIEHNTVKDLYRIKIASVEKEISISEWSKRDEKDPFYLKLGTATLKIGSNQYDTGKIAVKIENVLRKYLSNITKSHTKVSYGALQQLQDLLFRFVLLGKWNLWRNPETKEIKEFEPSEYEKLDNEKTWLPLGKAPFQPEWQNKNITFISEELINHPHNFGIIGGNGNLRILDIDDKTLIPYFKEKFKNTLIIQTGTRGIHIYLKSGYDKNVNLIKGGGEYRADNRYVVCPGCKHPNGEFYAITNDQPIKTYSEEEIKKILEPYVRKEDDITIAKVKDESRSGLEYGRVLNLLKEGKTKEEIFGKLLAYSKWKESPEQYKELTYKKALESIEKEKTTKDEKFDNLKSFITQFTNKLDLASQFYDIQPIYYSPQKIWWLWIKGKFKWEKVDETDLMNRISECSYVDTINSKIRTETLEALKQIGRKNKPHEPKKSWIQFKDKIIDIESGKIYNSTYKYFFTNPIPWKIGETEDTPNIDRIFKEWVYKEGVQDDSYVKTLKEIMAYCLLTHMPIQRIFCLIGNGSNGKGCFKKVIRKFLGVKNVSSTTIPRLCNIHFELSNLHKKLAVFIDEIDRAILTKTATLKSISGDDLAPIVYKGKDGFEDMLYATPITSCNKLPETTDKTKGYYRRWCIVDFCNEFEEKRDIIADIPDVEYENFAKQSIKILQELLKRGSFTNEGSIEDRKAKYEKRSNSIAEFIKEYCITNINKNVSLSEFTNKYNEWIASNDGRMLGSRKIAKILRENPYNFKITQQTVSGLTDTFISGISF